MTQHLTQNSQIAAGLEDPYTILNYSRNSSPGTQTLSHLPTPAPMSTACQSTHPSIPSESFHANPGNDKTPNDTPDMATTQDEADAKRFIMAINKLVQSHTSMSKPKLQDPIHSMVPIPKKLCTFIFQCKLNFWDCKDLFSTEEDKVNYALSHLKGITLDCFKPILWGCMTLFGSQILISSSWNSKTTLDLSTLKARQKQNLRHFVCMKIIKL